MGTGGGLEANSRSRSGSRHTSTLLIEIRPLSRRALTTAGVVPASGTGSAPSRPASSRSRAACLGARDARRSASALAASASTDRPACGTSLARTLTFSSSWLLVMPPFSSSPSSARRAFFWPRAFSSTAWATRPSRSTRLATWLSSGVRPADEEENPGDSS